MTRAGTFADRVPFLRNRREEAARLAASLKSAQAEQRLSALIAGSARGEDPYRGSVTASRELPRLLAETGGQQILGDRQATPESDAEEHLRQMRPVLNFEPQPAFTPKPRGTAVTAPMPVLGRDPLDPGARVRPLARPVIGDSMTPLPAGPVLPVTAYGPERAPVPSLYAGPGWAGRLMNLRVANHEWEDVQQIADQGMGRNAADMASGLRHNRAHIAEGLLQRCASIGRPELAASLLQRVDELVYAARAARAGAR